VIATVTDYLIGLYLLAGVAYFDAGLGEGVAAAENAVAGAVAVAVVAAAAAAGVFAFAAGSYKLTASEPYSVVPV